MPPLKDKRPPSPLVAAAQGFDEALRRFAAPAEGARKGGLDTQKGLERAAEALNEIAACEEDLQQRAQALMSALAESRDTQQAQAENVRTRALEIQKRTEDYAQVMRGFETLGQDAAA